MSYEILKDPTLNAIYESAIRILAFSAQPEKLLRIKLLKKEFPPEDIETVFELLREEKLLNDEEYGAGYARELVRVKHYGPNRIVAKLAEKGIDRYRAESFARDAMEEYGGEIEVVSRFIEKNITAIGRLFLKGEMAKIQSKLYNRGFKTLSTQLIKEIIEALLNEE